MNLTSGNALNWAAVISLIIGSMIISPSGSCLLYLIATVFSAITAICGTKKKRIAGIVILVISIVLLFVTYPRYTSHMKIWKEHIKRMSSQAQEKTEIFVQLVYASNIALFKFLVK